MRQRRKKETRVDENGRYELSTSAGCVCHMNKIFTGGYEKCDEGTEENSGGKSLYMRMCVLKECSLSRTRRRFGLTSL